MAKLSGWSVALAVGGAVFLSGCQGVKLPFGKTAEETPTRAATPKAGSSVKMVERDVEAPDVFQATDAGLWDGRPSLGGVWVAHPDVKEPERAIIRNEVNGKFVIGALFRRERENPGPKFQVSSDGAAALGMLAGQPIRLQVTALRREEVPEEQPQPEIAAAATEPAATDETTLLAEAETIEATALDDPIASAAAALDKIEADTIANSGGTREIDIDNVQTTSAAIPAAKPQTAAQVAAAADSAVQPTPAAVRAPVSSLTKPFIQIGIFSVEQNAKNTATSLRQIGVVPTVREQSSKGKTFWRVVVGPASNSAERSVLHKKVKDIGFEDAYFVTN